MGRQFPDFDFSKMNEADVREEIIAPLLRALGYRSGTENNIARENLLRYARAYIGRKKPEKDPQLTGKADYVLEVRGFARWILEAKPPDRNISIDDVEQAHTYASHPEVSALLFALCNGHQLKVFETWRPPNTPPVLDVAHPDLEREFGRVQSLLGPDGIKLSYPKIVVDPGNALAPGMRSRVRIRRGAAHYSELRVTPSLPLLPNMPPSVEIALRRAIDEHPGMRQTVEILKMLNHPIIGGECYRADAGQIEAKVEFGTLFPANAEVMRQLGLECMIFRTSDEQISTDPQRPTIFEGTIVTKLPAGAPFLNIGSGKTEPLAVEADVATYAEAVGAVTGAKFSGAMFQRIEIRMAAPVLSQLLILMENRGSFEIEVEPL